MTTARAADARPRSGLGEEGFTLIEVVVALMLSVIVMTATAGFFVRALASTRLMQQRQAAVALAGRMMEESRAVRVGYLASAGNYTADGAWSESYRVANTKYRATQSVVACWMPPGDRVCGPDRSPPNVLMYRVTVEITWSPGGGAKCGGATCTYTVSTLRDPSGSRIKDLKEVPL